MVRRFENQSVFITGASSGIGAALAEEFAREGAHVALAARNEQRLNEVRQCIESMGGRALALSCDVTDRTSIDAAVARTAEVFGGINVAVANAGFGVSGLFEQLSTDDYRRQFDTNFFGALDTVYAVFPYLKASQGRVGIVSSVLGRVGFAATSPYCASKFALCGLAESIDYEFREHGISVTCIDPGFVASRFRSVDNQNVFHPERPDHVPQWLCVSAKRAARAIVRALYRRKFEVVITGHGKIIVGLARHFPRTLRALTRTLGRGRVANVHEFKRGRPDP